MLRGVRFLAIGVPVLVVALFGSSLAVSGSKDIIHQGVKVSGVDLGGLTVDQAQTKLSGSLHNPDERHMVLKYNSRRFVIPYAELGAKADLKSSAASAFEIGRDGNFLYQLATIMYARAKGVNLPVIFSIDKEKAVGRISSLSSEIGCQPVDARLVINKGHIRILPSSKGIRLDVERNLATVTAAIDAGKGEVTLVVNDAPPKVTAGDLKGIDSVIASYSTNYRPGQRDRTVNLRIACHSIDGTVVKPGAVFSYNKEVGPRLKKFGFRDAPIFVNGEVEPGTGGGICQVSTTLYNTALLANMKIRRRAHHSQPVKYAPLGRDATVAYPSLDFEFENSSDAPIYVAASVGRHTVNVSILGKKVTGQEISLISEDRKVVKAPVVKQIDGSLKPGTQVTLEKGHRGQRVTIYRIVKRNGDIVEKELVSRNYYRPQSRIISVSRAKTAPISGTNR